MRGLFGSIGIQKGKPFTPDERMTTILTDAVAIGNATARALALRPREQSNYIFPDSAWWYPIPGGSFEWLKDGGDGGRNFDARTLFFYQATLNTPAMMYKMVGVGSQYAGVSTDSAGNPFDGAKSYRLTLPTDVPAKDFWSVVVKRPRPGPSCKPPNPCPA